MVRCIYVVEIRFVIIVECEITIPEGKNFNDIAERLSLAKLADKEIILSLKHDPGLLLKTGVPEATSLESFLFPETYFFSRAETEKQILSAMIAQYRKVFKNNFLQRIESKKNCF